MTRLLTRAVEGRAGAAQGTCPEECIFVVVRFVGDIFEKMFFSGPRCEILESQRAFRTLSRGCVFQG